MAALPFVLYADGIGENVGIALVGLLILGLLGSLLLGYLLVRLVIAVIRMWSAPKEPVVKIETSDGEVVQSSERVSEHENVVVHNRPSVNEKLGYTTLLIILLVMVYKSVIIYF
jgi:hypothetical protein